jgi:hypothetical protein
VPDLENVVALGVEYHHALIEVVVLHRAGGVQDRQRRVGLYHERIVRPSVVEIMTELHDK